MHFEAGLNKADVLSDVCPLFLPDALQHHTLGWFVRQWLAGLSLPEFPGFRWAQVLISSYISDWCQLFWNLLLWADRLTSCYSLCCLQSFKKSQASHRHDLSGKRGFISRLFEYRSELLNTQTDFSLFRGNIFQAILSHQGVKTLEVHARLI